MTDSVGPGVGFEFPPVEVKWLKRDLLLFAASIGASYPDELHFLYELHPNFAAFPTYPIVLPFKHADQEVIDFYARSDATPIPGVPKFDNTRVVDGERRLEFFRQLPVSSEGHKFEIRSRVLGVYDKGSPGTVVETEQLLVDAETGDVYTKATVSGFYVKQGGWGGPKGPSVPTYPPPPNTPPTATHTLQTTLETPHLYRLNGDYNPLHATPAPGAAMGFGGIIIHGLYSWNMAACAVLRAFGGSKAENLGAFQARFAAPVRPGDRLVVEMWRMGKEGRDESMEGELWEEVRFVVRGEGGKVVLSNGRAKVRVEDKAEGRARL